MTDPGPASESPPARHPSEPTLRELLAAPELRVRWVQGDDRAKERPVRWAHATELLDPSAYLRGGELVCTVGVALSDAAACRTFAEAVSGAKASALCFGVGDVHDDIPPALAQGCRDLGLPLLDAPRGAPFIAISEYLSERRIAAEAEKSRRGEGLVAQLLAGVRARTPLPSLLDVAAEVLQGSVELRVDGEPTVRAGRGAEPGAESSTAPVGDRGSLTWSGAGPPPSQALMEQLGRVIEVARHERDVEEVLERERIGHLLLLVGDRLASPLALRPMLDAAGLGDHPLVVSAWPAGCGPLLAGQMSKGLVGEAPGVALAVTGSASALRDVAAVVALAHGYGSAVALRDLGRGIAEARAALELARRSGQVVGPDGLTSLDGLLEQQPAERLSPFVDQLMVPLITSDDRHGTKHVDTLRSFLRLNGSLHLTAGDQYVHVNTVRHRLARIQQITGRDPMVFSDRVALAIALWAHDRTGSRPR